MLRREIHRTLQLAGPVVMTQIGSVAMGTVDTIMVGRLGAEPLGAVAIGNALSFTVLIVGMGTLMGLDPLVAQAFGAGRWRDCGRALRHGILLAVLLAIPTVAVLSQARLLLRLAQQPPDLVASGSAYVFAINAGTLPFLLFAALRQFLQGVGRVWPAMLVVLLANLLNAFANWLLVFGHWGFPAMGATGSAWATTLSRWAMLVALAAYVWWKRDLRVFGVVAGRGPVDTQLLRQLVRLGGPVGLQLGMEVGLFASVSVMMGWLGSVALAAHQVALNLCSITFMVPLGLSATAAVRVGHALGRDDVGRARRAALLAYVLGCGFMSCAAATFALIPEVLARIYTHDPEIVRLAAALLWIGAAYQISDGGQTIGIGALRGAADTRIPMFVTVVGYWLVGLPVGWLLAFRLGFEARGLWWGLTAGLSFVAVTLAWRFHARVRAEKLALLRA